MTRPLFNATLTNTFIRQAVPGLKTQAQSDAAALATDAFILTLDAITKGDMQAETQARHALTQALSAVSLATKAGEKAAQVEEKEQTPGMRQAVQPMVDEATLTSSLLTELAQTRDPEQLNAWYKVQRQRIDLIKDLSRRNEIFDTIRSRRALLTETQAKAGLGLA